MRQNSLSMPSGAYLHNDVIYTKDAVNAGRRQAPFHLVG